MWQVESAATNASSGSTASLATYGSGTTAASRGRHLDAAVEAPVVAAA